eukprot:scaffold110430_cov70-Attheya_sp.AAC.1
MPHARASTVRRVPWPMILFFSNSRRARDYEHFYEYLIPHTRAIVGSTVVDVTYQEQHKILTGDGTLFFFLEQRAQKTLRVDCILPSTIFVPLGRKHCNASIVAHDIVMASLSQDTVRK